MNKGMYAQGYADGIAVLIRFKHIVICLLVEKALTIERWCAEIGLTVDPAKKVIACLLTRELC